MQIGTTPLVNRVAPARRATRWRRYVIWYALITPNVVLFLLFGLIPILATLVASFTQWSLLGSPHWIGLQNYQRLAADPDFWTSLRVTFEYVLLFVLPSGALALGQALLLSLSRKLQVFFRTIYFVPVVTSVTVIAIIWGWLLTPDEIGPVNFFIGTVGIPTQGWLQSVNGALPSLAIIAIWSAVGYYMVLWLSGLQGIPQELMDAAMVDGADTWTRFWRITLPLLKPTTTFVLIIATINAFQAFALIYLLTGGGPLYNTNTMVYFAYRTGFLRYEMGYATAASVILVVIILGVTLIQRRSIGGWSDEVYA